MTKENLKTKIDELETILSEMKQEYRKEVEEDEKEEIKQLTNKLEENIKSRLNFKDESAFQWLGDMRIRFGECDGPAQRTDPQR